MRLKSHFYRLPKQLLGELGVTATLSIVSALSSASAFGDHSVQDQTTQQESANQNKEILITPCFVKGISGRVECIRLVSQDLNIVRIPSESILERPPLVLFAGGPGQAASDMSYLPMVGKLRQEQALLLIDQRGSGRNHPLDCKLEHAGSNEAKAEMKACYESTQELSPQLSSLQLVQDVENTRKVLEYDTLDLYGASYGTLVAQLYAASYPDRVHAMVLDGAFAIDQNPIVMASPYAQASLDYLATLCEKNSDCKAQFGNWTKDLSRLFSDLEKKPLPQIINGETVELNHQLLGQGIRAALYSPELAKYLPYGITQAAKGDWSLMDSLFASLKGITNSMHLGLSVGVLCKEQILKGNAEQAKQLGADSFAKDDFFSHWRMACPQDALPPHYLTPPQALSTPTLIISGALDPITPPKSAEFTLRYLTNAEHMVLPYDSHVNGSKPCIARYIQRFYLDEKQTEDCVEKSKPWPFNLGF